MNRPRTNRILLIAGAIALVVGLAFGKDQGDAETTRNTISAMLLTLGFLVMVAGLAMTAVRALRTRGSRVAD